MELAEKDSKSFFSLSFPFPAYTRSGKESPFEYNRQMPVNDKSHPKRCII